MFYSFVLSNRLAKLTYDWNMLPEVPGLDAMNATERMTEATGICVLAFLMASGIDEPLPRIGGPMHFGEFRDRFVLTNAGWRFAERRGRMVLKSA